MLHFLTMRAGFFIGFFVVFLTMTSSLLAVKTAVVSIGPLKDVVQAIAKDDLRILVLAESGRDPYTYKLNLQDEILLSKADYYIHFGNFDFEKEDLTDLKEVNFDLQIIDLSQVTNRFSYEHTTEWFDPRLFDYDARRQVKHVIKAEDEDRYSEWAGTEDPFVWLSLARMSDIAYYLGEYLASNDYKDYKSNYIVNRDDYISKLNKLHEDLLALTDNLFFVSLLSFRPSLGYFSRDYGLNNLYAITGDRPLTQEPIKRLISLSRDRNVEAVILEPFESRLLAQSVSKALDVPLIEFNPYRRDYLGNMTEFKLALTRSLNLTTGEN